MINLKKYKRLITFGCSFTRHIWPSWADILATEIPDATFINLGKAGAGNAFISYRISEANLRLKFNQDDLVVVMWSTFCREDRYLNDYWQTPGNIFTQGFYPDSFVKNFTDTKGYLIRDLNLINLTKSFLDNAPCDYLMLPSVPWNYQNEDRVDVTQVLKLYDSVINGVPSDLFSTEMKGHWENGHTYDHPTQGKQFQDYHPAPIRYYNYLKQVGLPLTDDSYRYAVKSTKRLRSCKTDQEIKSAFNLDANLPPTDLGNGINVNWF